jgi:hypothetical protein
MAFARQGGDETAEEGRVRTDMARARDLLPAEGVESDADPRIVARSQASRKT